MKIVLVNAAAPAFPREDRYTPDAFLEAVRVWEETPVESLPESPVRAGHYRVWTASSAHARQTAALWLRPEEGVPAVFETTPLLDEIPLLPFTQDGKEHSLREYRRQGIRQWKKGDARQPENRVQSREKAETLLGLLEERGEDVILISHERRILVLAEALRKRGYQLRRGSLFHLAPLERILAAKFLPSCGGCGHNCLLSHPGCVIGQEKAAVLRKKDGSVKSRP